MFVTRPLLTVTDKLHESGQSSGQAVSTIVSAPVNSALRVLAGIRVRITYLRFRSALILLAIVLAVAPLPRALVERLYARGMYPMLQPRMTALSNTTPVALFDVVLLLGAAATVLLWRSRWRKHHARSERSTRFGTLGLMLFDALSIAAILYLWFLGTWGLNYRREPLRAQLDFHEDRVTSGALVALAGRTTDALNALYSSAHAAGWPELTTVQETLQSSFADAQRDLSMTWTAHAGRPKRTLFNFYFTRVSIDGMTDPFFLETLANQSLLPFERASTIAHEWAHLAGYADESEASFVGWLICMRGPAPSQYSGWLSLYGPVAGALTRDERASMTARLDAGPRNDLQAIADRIQRQTIPIASRAGYAMYDRFLKANRVESGVRSYGEVVQLMLGTNFDANGAPVRRRQD